MIFPYAKRCVIGNCWLDIISTIKVKLSCLITGGYGEEVNSYLETEGSLIRVIFK